MNADEIQEMHKIYKIELDTKHRADVHSFLILD